MGFAFVFPGQGSQAVGMLAEHARLAPQVAELFERASDLLGVRLWDLVQQGPQDVLSLTENTQPALLTAGYAVWQIWLQNGGDTPSVMAGHSLGEYTAMVCAGCLEFDDAVTLVRDRGRFMQEAVPAGQGAMAAVIGLDDEAVVKACADYAEGEVLEAVNFNAPGQVVIAGDSDAVERFIVAGKDIGARRVLPLTVSIPAHSKLMTPAAERLAMRLEDVPISPPVIPVVHNVNAATSSNADEIRDNVIRQANSPVLWSASVQAMIADGCTTFIESGPGKVLGGVIKRVEPASLNYSVDGPDRLQLAIEAVAAK
jgi:[acyl-carrier-protein] S-malonyltransferase